MDSQYQQQQQTKSHGSTDEIKPESGGQKKQITYKCYYTKIEAEKTNEKIQVDKDVENTTGRFTITGLDTNGVYDIEVVAEDPAGNTSNANISTQTKGELKKPSINITAENGTSRTLDGIEYYNKDNGNLTVTIQDTAEENTSATKIGYKITDKNGQEIEGTGNVPITTITSVDYDFPVDGTYKIEAWVEDENISEGQERKNIRKRRKKLWTRQNCTSSHKCNKHRDRRNNSKRNSTAEVTEMEQE